MARKRINGEGSIRKRKNGTWEGRISVGVNPETGKILTKSVYGRTKKEVHDKMTALLSGEGLQAASPTAVSGTTDEPEPQTDEMTVSE